MNTTISAQSFDLSPAISRHAEEKINGALNRFRHHIVSIDVFLRDINGPKGGKDKQVLLRVRLGNRQVVTVESTRSDLYAAISCGSRRAKRSVKRTLKKMQRFEKRGLRDLRWDGVAESAAPS